jgi:hypothetical protein
MESGTYSSSFLKSWHTVLKSWHTDLSIAPAPPGVRACCCHSLCTGPRIEYIDMLIVLQAGNILVATGSRAVIAPVEGAKEHGMNSDHILNLDALPKRYVLFNYPDLLCRLSALPTLLDPQKTSYRHCRVTDTAKE